MSATASDLPQARPVRAVFVYEWPMRLCHWLIAISIVVLTVTGFYIGEPFLGSRPGEAVDQFFMGYMRFAHFAAGGGIGAHQRHGLADGLLHQFLRSEEVEVKVLLDDTGGFGREAQRLGPDLRRDVGKSDRAAARRDRELPHVLHQTEAVVVDRDRDIALRGCVGIGGVLREHRLDGESSGRNGQQGTNAHEGNLPMLYCIK